MTHEVSGQTHCWHNDLPTEESLWKRVEKAGADAVLSLGAWTAMGAGMTGWARKAQAAPLE